MNRALTVVLLIVFTPIAVVVALTVFVLVLSIIEGAAR